MPRRRSVPALGAGDPVDQGPGFTLPPLSQLPGADPPGQPGTQLPPETFANGIPAQALAAYQRAAQLLSAADPECRVDWPLIAAIGKVESNHGRYAGNGLDLNLPTRAGAGSSDVAAPEGRRTGCASSGGPAPQPTWTGSGSGSAGTGSPAGSGSTGTGSGSPAPAQSSGSLEQLTKAVSSVLSSLSSSTTRSSPSPTETCYVNLLGGRVCDPL